MRWLSGGRLPADPASVGGRRLIKVCVLGGERTDPPAPTPPRRPACRWPRQPRRRCPLPPALPRRRELGGGGPGASAAPPPAVVVLLGEAWRAGPGHLLRPPVVVVCLARGGVPSGPPVAGAPLPPWGGGRRRRVPTGRRRQCHGPVRCPGRGRQSDTLLALSPLYLNLLLLLRLSAAGFREAATGGGTSPPRPVGLVQDTALVLLL